MVCSGSRLSGLLRRDRHCPRSESLTNVCGAFLCAAAGKWAPFRTAIAYGVGSLGRVARPAAQRDDLRPGGPGEIRTGYTPVSRPSGRPGPLQGRCARPDWRCPARTGGARVARCHSWRGPRAAVAGPGGTGPAPACLAPPSPIGMPGPRATRAVSGRPRRTPGGPAGPARVLHPDAVRFSVGAGVRLNPVRARRGRPLS